MAGTSKRRKINRKGKSVRTKKHKRRRNGKRTRPRGFTTASEQGSSRGTMTTIPRGIQALWPDVLRTTMVWYHNTGTPNTIEMSGTTGQQYLRIRGNSVFDPNFATGITQGQPAGFDDYAAKYNRYRVLASSIVVTAWTSRAIETNIPGASPNDVDKLSLRTELCVMANDINVVQSAANRDARYEGRFKMSGPFKRKWITNQNPGMGKKTIKLYCSTSNAVDIGYQEVQNDIKFAALVDDNPETEWFWLVNLMPDTGQNSAQGRFLDVKVWVKYYVQFEDRILNIPQS